MKTNKTNKTNKQTKTQKTQKAQTKRFKKGMKVIRFLSGGGQITQEDAVVLKVDKKGVWLDNGDGNDPSGPFIDNGKTCSMEGVFGFWSEIKTQAQIDKEVKEAKEYEDRYADEGEGYIPEDDYY
jgi:hypothetical protein